MGDSPLEEDNFKKLYFIVKRFDLGGSQRPPVTLLDINIPNNCSSDVMIQCVRKDLDLTEKGIVLKLRNQRGSLIIPMGSLEANSANTPYILEIARIHQSMKPKDRSIFFSEPKELVKSMLTSLVNRISRMEDQIPDLPAMRQCRIEREILDINCKLDFIQTRLDVADQLEWSGTPKNTPLW